MKTRYPKANPRHIFYRNYKNFDKVTFNDHLLWYLQATPAAHINVCKFQESFLHVLNIYAPMKKEIGLMKCLI